MPYFCALQNMWKSPKSPEAEAQSRQKIRLREKQVACILNTNSGICLILHPNRKCKTQLYKCRNKLGVVLVSRTRDCRMKINWESEGKDTVWRLEWGNSVWRKGTKESPVPTLERTGTMDSQKKKWKWVMKCEKAIFFLMISFTKLSRVLKGKIIVWLKRR